MSMMDLLVRLLGALASDDEPRSLLEGSSLTGDMNFRTDQFDCGLDPGGFYEDDL